MNIQPFEEYTNQYEAWFEKNPWVYRSELQALKKLLPHPGQGIEIGVGSGRFAAPLGIRLGVEPSAQMRALAKTRGVEVVAASGENLPFRGAQFDSTLMVTTLCFLDDIEKSFLEIRRILKPEGCLVIGFVDKDSPVGKTYQRHKEESRFYKIATFYSTDEVVRSLKSAGFGRFLFHQTLFRSLEEIHSLEPVKSGYGEGSFVVLKALTPRQRPHE